MREPLLRSPEEQAAVLEKHEPTNTLPNAYWDDLEHPNKATLLSQLVLASTFDPGSVTLVRMSSVLDQAIEQGTLPDHTDWTKLQIALHETLGS